MSKHVLIGVAGVVSFLVISMMYVQRTVLEPLVLHSNVLLIDSGSSLRDFAGMITLISDLESPVSVMAWVLITGRASSLKAGEYKVRTGDSVEDIVAQVVAGKVIEHSITFPEGFEFRDVLARLNSVESLLREEGDLSLNLIKQAIGTDHELLEGLFFPDTYHYIRSDTPISILRRANDVLKMKLQDAWSSRDKDLLLKSPYELLILASIIEKEAVVAHEKPRISGVFVN